MSSESLHREPAVAGQFYPGDPETLRQTVSAYLAETKVEPAPERVAAVVGPHAGYVFSGLTAAHAYARAAGHQWNRVVLLGCSHHYRFEGAAIPVSGAFATPLGHLPIDAPFARDLVEEFGSADLEAHGPEHSIEVHLPFVQVALGDVSIVPVLFGSAGTEWHVRFGDYLASRVDDHTLVAISTDLSHYYPEPQANRLDHTSLDTLLTQDVEAYLTAERDARSFMCGATAVAAGMEYALRRDAHDWRVLDYRTSAAASGDTSRVVGYAAVTMERAA